MNSRRHAQPPATCSQYGTTPRAPGGPSVTGSPARASVPVVPGGASVPVASGAPGGASVPGTPGGRVAGHAVGAGGGAVRRHRPGRALVLPGRAPALPGRALVLPGGAALFRAADTLAGSGQQLPCPVANARPGPPRHRAI